ncbi:MAG: FAD-dependent oxidoreductase [Acidimicrobiia bacterium]
MKRYENLVVGGGMAGLPLALRAARHGSTAFVERERLGGTCLNRGCIPTKTMIASASLAHRIGRASEFGIEVGPATVDLGAVVDRKDTLVESIRAGSYRAVEKASDLDFYEGHGTFLRGRSMKVGDEVIVADRIFLNTGTRDAVSNIEGLDAVPHLTSRTILDLRLLPEHLVVVGGGFVGCEMAQMFSRFGAHVTIVQRGPRLLESEDPEASEVVETAFRLEGIDVLTDTACVAVEPTDQGVRVHCRGAEDTFIVASHLLVAAGRTPNSDELGLEYLEVATDSVGFVPVDDRLRTSADGVWALGDLRGGPMFTHTARHDADVIIGNLFRGVDSSIAGRVVPHAVFVDPEVASVGLTEDEAKAAGYPVTVGRQEFRGVAKARAIGETDGFVKIIADSVSGMLLGCHIVGPDAGNLIHEAVIAMVASAPATVLRDAIHVHPTLAESVNAAAGGVHRPAAADD